MRIFCAECGQPVSSDELHQTHSWCREARLANISADSDQNGPEFGCNQCSGLYCCTKHVYHSTREVCPACELEDDRALAESSDSDDYKSLADLQHDLDEERHELGSRKLRHPRRIRQLM